MPLEHPVPPALLERIGDIIVSYALLESMTQQLAGSFIREHQRVGQIVTTELSFRQVRGLLISLYLDRHGEDDEFAEIRKHMKRAAKMEETRNRIVHSIWGAGASSRSVTRIRSTAKEGSGLQFSSEQHDEATLGAMATEIRELAGELQSLHFRMIKSGKAINNPFEKMW